MESPAEHSENPMVFRAPLFRVQKGLKIVFKVQKPTPHSEHPTKAALALAMGYRYRKAVEQGEVRDFASLAKKLKVSRAWVSMRVELTFLAPRIQQQLLGASRRERSIQALVTLARLKTWEEQLARMGTINKDGLRCEE